MGVNPLILDSKVFHKRLFPKVNSFKYEVLYFIVPIDKENNYQSVNKSLINKLGLIKFSPNKHGDKKGGNLHSWIYDILSEYSLADKINSVSLICMPQFFGYVFNPVSFWVCRDKAGDVLSVLCEVNNTFGETHLYLCKNPDNSPIKPDYIMRSDKVFHVSPFLERKGYYEFKFNLENSDKIAINIDYFDEDGRKKLITSVAGSASKITNFNLFKSLFKYPLLTFKVVYLIHWQALKLVIKKIKFIKKPKQYKTKITSSNGQIS